MAEHGIDWLNQPGYKGEGWPLVTGCTQEKAGCVNCWAARWASHPWLARLPQYAGLTRDGRWTGEVRFHADLLDKPLHWRKRRCVFVAPTGDIGHIKVTENQRDLALAVMAHCPSHRFILLTKRPENLSSYFSQLNVRRRGYWHEHCGYLADCAIKARLITKKESRERYNIARRIFRPELPEKPQKLGDSSLYNPGWPLPNVWLYYSASTQEDLDEGLPHLLKCRATVRGLSLEPLLEPLNLDLTGIDHVIVGGESGPNARPFEARWLGEIRVQCAQAAVPLYFKQFGANATILGTPLKLRDPKGSKPAQWPKGYREFREFPKAAEESE